MEKKHPLTLYRKLHRLTQVEMASRLGVSQGQLAKLESGERPVLWHYAKKWEKTLGISKEILCPEVYE